MKKVKLNSVQARVIAKTVAEEAQEKINKKIKQDFPKKYSQEIKAISILYTQKQSLERDLTRIENQMNKLGERVADVNKDVDYSRWNHELSPRTGVVSKDDIDGVYSRIILKTVNPADFDVESFMKELVAQIVKEKTN